jgi:hypothetical protein
MVKILKQNGHPVSLKGISFIYPKKQYPKEACDIHTQYNTIFRGAKGIAKTQNNK